MALVLNSICESSIICILDIGLASELEGKLLEGPGLLAVKMFRMALHSTVETHPLYSAGGGALQRLSPGTLQHQVGTLQHPTHPVLLQHCVGLFPSTLQHWVGTLQHPKAPIVLLQH